MDEQIYQKKDRLFTVSSRFAVKDVCNDHDLFFNKLSIVWRKPDRQKNQSRRECRG